MAIVEVPTDDFVDGVWLVGSRDVFTKYKIFPLVRLQAVSLTGLRTSRRISTSGLRRHEPWAPRRRGEVQRDASRRRDVQWGRFVLMLSVCHTFLL